MTIQRVQLNPVGTDPCDKTSLQRALAGLFSNIQNVASSVNQVIDITNINNIEVTINEIVNQIINNNTFIQEVHEHVTNVIQTFHTSIYAQSILFELNNDMTFSSGYWQASADVLESYNGDPPEGSVVTVRDPAKGWRWKSTEGAKGVAVRANVEGTVYMIIEMQRVPEHIRGKVDGAFSQSNQAFECDIVDEKFDGFLDPFSLTDTGKLWIRNPPVSGGAFMFDGQDGDTFMASLIDKENKPANNTGDPFYECFQKEC